MGRCANGASTGSSTAPPSNMTISSTPSVRPARRLTTRQTSPEAPPRLFCCVLTDRKSSVLGGLVGHGGQEHRSRGATNTKDFTFNPAAAGKYTPKGGAKRPPLEEVSRPPGPPRPQKSTQTVTRRRGRLMNGRECGNVREQVRLRDEAGYGPQAFSKCLTQDVGRYATQTKLPTLLRADLA